MIRLHRQHGVSMLEIMVAVGILGVAGVALLLGMNTAFRSQDISREQVRGENLARAQLEYIRFVDYDSNYSDGCTLNAIPVPVCVPPPDALIPSDYSITVTTSDYCDGLGPDGLPGGDSDCYPSAEIQKNAVSVFRNGKGLIVVEDLRTKR